MPKIPEDAHFAALMDVIRKILRERKISYSDLGRKIQLSESGVKKLFTAKDVSFSRISQIAGVLNLKVLELLEEVEDTSFENVHFTAPQQAAFLKDHLLFTIYYKLVIERMTSDEANRHFKFKEKTYFAYLNTLDHLGLIELMKGGTIKVPRLRNVRSFGDGPFLSKLYKKWGVQLVHDLARPENQSSGQFVVRCLMMKGETYQEFLNRLLELEREFTRRAIREMNLSTKDLKPMRWMSFSDQQSFEPGGEEPKL